MAATPPAILPPGSVKPQTSFSTLLPSNFFFQLINKDLDTCEGFKQRLEGQNQKSSRYKGQGFKFGFQIIHPSIFNIAYYPVQGRSQGCQSLSQTDRVRVQMRFSNLGFKLGFQTRVGVLKVRFQTLLRIGVSRRKPLFWFQWGSRGTVAVSNNVQGFKYKLQDRGYGFRDGQGFEPGSGARKLRLHTSVVLKLGFQKKEGRVSKQQSVPMQGQGFEKQ